MTEMQKTVKKRLVDMDRTQNWLIVQVADQTGLYFDSSYLSKILRGVKRQPIILAAIEKILDLKLSH